MSVFHQKRQPVPTLLKGIASLAVALAAVFLLLCGARTAAKSSREEEIRVLTRNLQRAAVQCYALEGFYPPNASYIQEHLGVTVDENKYAVHYEIFASNVAPEITVVPR